MQKSIVLIGCGELGSRHLQSIIQLDNTHQIFVIDPSEHSMDIAKERCDQIKSTHPEAQEPIFMKDTHKLPESIDFLIIATNSDVRSILFEQVLLKHQVRFCLLEKLLAQSLKELDNMGKIVEESGTKVWVNCCQRYWPFFDYIKEYIYEKDFTILVEGTDWNLCSNSIHNIDLLSYLSNDSSDINSLVIGPTVNKESKRIGFSDIYGTIISKGSSNSKLIQTSKSSGNQPLSFIILSDEFYATYDVGSQKAYMSIGKDNDVMVVREFPIPYQSSMTSDLIVEIYRDNKCNLPTLKESISQHYSLFNGLSTIFNKEVSDSYLYKLPIT